MDDSWLGGLKTPARASVVEQIVIRRDYLRFTDGHERHADEIYKLHGWRLIFCGKRWIPEEGVETCWKPADQSHLILCFDRFYCLARILECISHVHSFSSRDITALMASTAAAFAPATPQSGSNFALHATANRAAPKALITSKVDSTGNNIAVKNFLESAEATGLLTKVAKSGLLSKAAAAGITLSKLEPLIITASQKGILDEVLILTEAAGPDILPLLPTVVDLAPQALPLLALGLDIPPVALQGAALASIGAAYGVLTIVPDDTVAQVAVQTLAVAVLGVAAPVASLVGATILGKIRSL